MLGLKNELGLKIDLKNELGLKSALKQSNALKQSPALKSVLQQVSLSPTIVTYNNITSNSKFKTPAGFSFPIMIGSSQQLKRKSKKKKRIKSDLEALFPDFTARAIGLAPTKVSGVAGAMKEIKKLQTGFEIRRGAKIDANFFGNKKKGKKGMSDKQLMRSVMA